MADTGKHLGKFNLAVALHAGHAHHFTGPDFQIHAVECLNATVVPGAELLCPNQDFTGGGFSVIDDRWRHILAHHHTDQSGLGPHLRCEFGL